MDSAEFHAAVYEMIRTIPICRVTTYGHIAKLIGMPNHSRHVGQALKYMGPSPNPPIPWHRVVGANGTISSRGPGTEGARRQMDALVAEGVEVNIGRTGEMKIDFARWGWFPQPEQAVVPRADSDDGGSEPGSP